MEKLLNVSSSPHVRNKITTQNLMFDVAIAMIPASVYGVWQFGMHALLVLIATVVSCVLSEYVYEKLMKKPITVSDGSAVVTGMILALNMPPEIPVWIPFLGGIFAIIVVKQLYGGLGQNFMNPALAARCFLLISFAGHMNNFSSAKLGFDSVSGLLVFVNGLSMVSLYAPCGALSSKSEKLFFTVPQRDEQTQTGKQEGDHNNGAQQIWIHTADEYCAQHGHGQKEHYAEKQGNTGDLAFHKITSSIRFTK